MREDKQVHDARWPCCLLNSRGHLDINTLLPVTILMPCNGTARGSDTGGRGGRLPVWPHDTDV